MGKVSRGLILLIEYSSHYKPVHCSADPQYPYGMCNLERRRKQLLYLDMHFLWIAINVIYIVSQGRNLICFPGMCMLSCKLIDQRLDTFKSIFHTFSFAVANKCDTLKKREDGTIPLTSSMTFLAGSHYSPEFSDRLYSYSACQIARECNTRQLPMGAGYCQWGGLTDRNICNIYGDAHLASRYRIGYARRVHNTHPEGKLGNI